MDEKLRVFSSGNNGAVFRSVTYLIFVVLIGVSLLIPASVGQKGWYPPDDALRHAAKAISGKAWDQILVLREDVTIDPHFGWHATLGFLHHTFGMDQYALLVFQVAACFFLFAAVPLFFTKRPEAWHLALLVMTLAEPAIIFRLFLGRPFIISAVLLACLCFFWKSFAGRSTPWMRMVGLTLAFALTTWLHPSPYLFIFPIACFLAARQWRAAGRITSCFLAGAIAGFCLTGHPIKMVQLMLFVIFNAPDQAILTRMLVSEFQPDSQVFPTMIVVSFLLFWRYVRGKWDRHVIDNPVFYVAIAGIFLGHFVSRFWWDWGLVAALVWIAGEFSEMLQERVSVFSLHRLGIAAAITISFYFVVTADVESRWSSDNPHYPPDLSNATTEERKFFPDSGGIVYSDNMTVFYRMFFWNPHAPWRYVLGFEPALMPPEQLTIYRKIQRTNGDIDAWLPWIQQMKYEDRLIIFSGAQPQTPDSLGLTWGLINRHVWSGRRIRQADDNSLSLH